MRPPRAPARTTTVTAILIALGVIRSCREKSCPSEYYAKFPEHSRDRRNREPDDIRPGSIDPVDESRGPALNRIGARLAFRLSGAHVPLEFVSRNRQQVYPGADD